MQPAQPRASKRQIRYWCADESRVGLFTVQRRQLTALGVQPQGRIQWQFVYRWFYGAVEPMSGELFLLEFSHLDSACFETFLHQFATQYPQDLHLIQVDNSMAHKAQSLQVPSNVRLLFQPPYCPETNPIERLWLALKDALRWRLFQNLEELQGAISQWSEHLTRRQVKSLTQWKWLVDALCVAGV